MSTADALALARMIDHLAWADHRVAQALAAADAVPPAILTLFAHVVAAEHVWYARLVGTTPAYPVWPELSVEAAAALGRENVERLRDLIATLDPDELRRDVVYANSAGKRFTTETLDILIHLCLHGAYHRGQIALALRQAGRTPVPTDYIEFVRGSPAATRQH